MLCSSLLDPIFAPAFSDSLFGYQPTLTTATNPSIHVPPTDRLRLQGTPISFPTHDDVLGQLFLLRRRCVYRHTLSATLCSVELLSQSLVIDGASGGIPPALPEGDVEQIILLEEQRERADGGWLQTAGSSLVPSFYRSARIE